MTTGNPDDESRLASLVDSIDEDVEVDWDAAEREARDEDERDTVQQLRLLSRIARACRDSHEARTPTAPDPARAAPAASITQWGSLRVREPIGQGAFGTVYRAIDRLDREVALKLLRLGPGTTPAERHRILREGRLLARISHDNVVPVLGADEVDGQVGIWMNLVRGFTLEQELASRGPLSSREATVLGLDLCRALAAVHGAGLLHRDIKAQNVMRESGGRILLMDLGAGLDVARDILPESRRVTGTPLYLAPELFSRGTPSVATDVYSVGVLLYHLVTNEFPVDGDTIDDVARMHARGERRRLRDVRADLPDAFVTVVERALAREPAARYRSAGEFADALAELLPGKEPLPRPHPQGWKSWAAGGLAAGLIGVGAWLVAAIVGVPSPPRADQPLSASATAPAGAPAAAVPLPARTDYDVEAVFYRRSAGGDTRLQQNARLTVGDELFVTIRASQPVYAYVYTEDEAGEAYLLFPLAGQALANPLAADRAHRLPGVLQGRQMFWQVSSTGGREHFLVFVSPVREESLEAALRDIPPPEFNQPLASRVPERVVGTLRGVGGLVAGPGRTSPGRRLSLEAPLLGDTPETVSGLWIRRLTLANP